MHPSDAEDIIRNNIYIYYALSLSRASENSHQMLRRPELVARTVDARNDHPLSVMLTLVCLFPIFSGHFRPGFLQRSN